MKSLITLILFSSVSMHLYGQNELKTFVDLTTKESNSTNYQESKNITVRGLNMLLAKKTLSYLSSEADLNLNKGYFIADISDKKLNLGRNFALIRGEEALGLVFTPSLVANGEDKFAELFKSKKWQSDIGVSAKFVFMGKGSVFFDKKADDKVTNGKWEHPVDQQYYMAQQRLYNQKKILNDYLQKVEHLKASYNALPESDFKNKASTELDELNAKAIEEWYEAEVESFDNLKAHNASSLHWVSLWGTQYLTGQDYKTRDTITAITIERNFKSSELNASYTYVRDGRDGRFFWTIGCGIVYQNTASIKKMKELKFNDYKYDSVDTLFVGEENDGKLLIGNYESFASTKVFSQVVYYFPKIKGWDKCPWDKNFGLSLKPELVIGHYNWVNCTLGVPFILKGKDEKTKLNVEFQMKWQDVTNSLNPEKGDLDNFVVGINLAMPFSSLLY